MKIWLMCRPIRSKKIVKLLFYQAFINMYSLVQSKLACTLEPRKEANKSPEYGEVFGWSRLLLLL